MGSRSLSFTLVRLVLLASLGLAGAFTSAASAQPANSAAVKDAGKHFQRGVALYNEADYRAALVEFRRAYDTAPNPAVLYNIGQAYYQLQNYAAALTALERYLNESGPAAAHRQEVEQTIATLQARVGKIAITTNVPDCEISVDDEVIGKTPLTEPVLVSIGRRKVTAVHEGSPPDSRSIDVAAGDTVAVALQVATTAGTPAAVQAKAGAGPSDGKGLVTVGWITTGVAGGAAIVLGGLAFWQSRKLSDLRSSFDPARDPMDVKSDLDKKSSNVKILSYFADGFGAVALVAGGLTLKMTLSRSSDHEVHVAVAPNGIQLAGTFR
ncbi:MAG TPA: PEGA domain-containing protein [Kofleriaceae bacterium]|nr:PEGA domain-containing protein [Kofleriaceae bacterium]